MSARTVLAERLAELLGSGYRVEPAKVVIDNTDRPVVLVDRAAIQPGEALGLVDHTLEVLLVSEHLDVELAEDDLDARLPVVLEALEDDASGYWTKADRVQYGAQDAAQYHAWRITYTVTRETP